MGEIPTAQKPVNNLILETTERDSLELFEIPSYPIYEQDATARIGEMLEASIALPEAVFEECAENKVLEKH